MKSDRRRASRKRSVPAAPIEGIMSYTEQHLAEAATIIEQIDHAAIEQMADVLAAVRARGGRLFFLGVGGSAGNCSHAVNDFRKIAGFEAYAPTDNVSELTARTNDEGWETVFVAWLQGQPAAHGRRASSCSRSAAAASRRTSARTSCARCEYAKRGRRRRSSASSAATAATRRQVADACVIVPTVNPDDRHAAHRSVPGGGLAPAGLASAAQGGARRSGSPTR